MKDKKHIITIAGNAGGGKSTVAKMVAKKLGYDHYSSGDFMRQVARERGVTLEELHEMAENDSSIDHDIDARNKEVGKQDELVIDSRLAFHFIPQSFSVFLSVDTDTAAKRILADSKKNRQEERKAATLEDVKEKIHERMESNKKRYKELYGIDYLDTEQFDLVIDTSNTTPDEVTSRIIAGYNEWLE